MTIAPHVAQKFLHRALNDFDWVKKTTDQELDDALAEIRPTPHFHTKPYKHQRACFLIGYYFPEFLFLLDMGLGKTKIVLDLLYQFRREGRMRRVLITVPGLPHMANWSDELARHRPEFSNTLLIGTTEERREQALSCPSDIHIINYQGFMMMAAHRTPTGKKGAMKNAVTKVSAEPLKQLYDSFVSDESQKIKNRSSLQWKACVLVSAGCQVRYALTGTPVGRDPQDFWAQYYFVDRGYTLGPSLTFFRDCFFDKKPAYFGGFDYKLKKKYKDTLYRTLKNASLWYGEEECGDMPEKVYLQRVVTMPDNFESHHADICKELVEARGDYHLVESVFHRMRNISSGFLNVKDDEDNSIKIPFPVNPKIEEVLEILEGSPPASKHVIFYDYTYTAKMLTEALAKKKIGFEWLWSGTKDQLNSVKRFNNTKKCKVLVCQTKIGSSGLNLQVANYVIFIESPVSSIDRQQAEKRCHRQGQKAKRVFYYDVIMKNSVDEKILGFIKEGKSLFQSLVKGEKKTFELFYGAP